MRTETKKATPVKTAPNVIPVEAPKTATILSAPTGNMPQNMLSINELKTKIKDNLSLSSSDLADRPMEEFTKDQLLMEWQKYAHSLLEQEDEKAHSIAKVMLQKGPELKQGKVFYKVENYFVYDSLKTNFLPELTVYLRNSLKNWGVAVELEYVQIQTVEETYLSGKDRFEKLLQKNNNLLSLKKTFNLDIEF